MIDIFSIIVFLGIIAIIIALIAWFSIPFFITWIAARFIKNTRKKEYFAIGFWSLILYLWTFLGWFVFRMLVPTVSRQTEPLIEAIRFSTSPAILVVYVPVLIVGIVIFAFKWKRDSL